MRKVTPKQCATTVILGYRQKKKNSDTWMKKSATPPRNKQQKLRIRIHCNKISMQFHALIDFDR
jgi:hypothetical protein